MTKTILIVAIVIIATSCNSNANKDAAIKQAKQQTIDSIQALSEKQKIIDSMTILTHQNKSNTNYQTRQQNNSEMGAPSEATSTDHNASTSQNNTVVTKKKKGLNATETGALIGAGAGAITGAMVDGKKGEGAIVGGLIGAAAGAGTGAIIDGKKKKKVVTNN
ncbi:hypothetical protein ACFOW1_07085 [Parasediminibacterium paludis]|jgi:hypothetical protein|uniref:YmgG-like glycine-zipper protein n=1 Tax=Parasediminibacterium paludis TaxID=908966 RepID=A0ABV8PUD8_9BACT